MARGLVPFALFASFFLSSCSGVLSPSPMPSSDIQATVEAQVATQLAALTPTIDLPATVSAQSTQIAALAPTISLVTTLNAQATQLAEIPQATPTLDDETALKHALLAKLGWNEAELQFNIAENNGQIARGSLKRLGEMSGAAWFAGRQADGHWTIAYIGQGVPLCADIQVFNFPKDWISHCVDASGNAVER